MIIFSYNYIILVETMYNFAVFTDEIVLFDR